MITCNQCGQPPADGELSIRGLCESCGVTNLALAAAQQHARSGPFYDRQRTAVRRRRPPTTSADRTEGR